MTSAASHIKQKIDHKIERWYTQVSWDVPDIKYIKKFQHGTSDPHNPLTEKEKVQQLENINRELRYGKIVSIETNINEIKIGGSSVIQQWTVFLIGYRNRPDGK